jgi:hypothetical protein
MDNLGNSDLPKNDSDEPIPFDDGLDANGGSPGVSRAPLNLGGGNPTPAPTANPKPARPEPRPAPPAAVPPTGATPVAAPAGPRITGCKVFFAKLHAGAIDFMSDQISNWLKENPDIHIKHTNLSVGDVQAKKTEPNLLIVVWY